MERGRGNKIKTKYAQTSPVKFLGGAIGGIKKLAKINKAANTKIANVGRSLLAPITGLMR